MLPFGLFRNLKILTVTHRNIFQKPLNLVEMEGFIVKANGNMSASPDEKLTPSKRTNFVGISPQKELNNIITPTDRPFRVSVEGNIGSGKSTFLNYFSQFSGIETHSEPLEWWRNLDGHNMFELMYKDPQKWYNTFQMYVQFTRLKIQTTPPKNSNTTVQMYERSLQNNRYCFVEQAYKNGLLHAAEYANIDAWYIWAKKNFDITLDLIVYLRSTPEVVYQRMKERQRAEESAVKLEYLKQLHDSYETWLMTDDFTLNTVPVLVLDADKALEDIYAQCKLNENKILGHEKRGTKPVMQDDKNRVKKKLDLS